MFERVARGAASTFAIRVIGRMGAVLRLGRSTADQLSVSFDRTVAAVPVQVELHGRDPGFS